MQTKRVVKTQFELIDIESETFESRMSRFVWMKASSRCIHVKKSLLKLSSLKDHRTSLIT